MIPAAGLGTRFLPATKAVPKEMLPIVDMPTIQLVIDEAVRAGITDVVAINGRNKHAIEDHFDHAFELERTLRDRGKAGEADAVAGVAAAEVRHGQPRLAGEDVRRVEEGAAPGRDLGEHRGRGVVGGRGGDGVRHERVGQPAEDAVAADGDDDVVERGEVVEDGAPRDVGALGQLVHREVQAAVLLEEGGRRVDDRLARALLEHGTAVDRDGRGHAPYTTCKVAQSAT